MRSTKAIDEQIARVEVQTAESRVKAVEVLAEAADAAGLLVRELDPALLASALADLAAAHADAPYNRYGKRRQKLNGLALTRIRAAKQERKEDDRAKYILGGFLLAQFRRSPEVLEELSSLIEDYVNRQEDERLRVADLALISQLIAMHSGSAGREPTKQLLRSAGLQLNKANRATIILGAFALSRMEEQPAVATAWRPGIEAFVKAADTAKAREVGKTTVKAVFDNLFVD